MLRPSSESRGKVATCAFNVRLTTSAEQGRGGKTAGNKTVVCSCYDHVPFESFISEFCKADRFTNITRPYSIKATVLFIYLRVKCHKKHKRNKVINHGLVRWFSGKSPCRQIWQPNSVPRSHKVERKQWLPQVVLWPLCECHNKHVHTCAHTLKKERPVTHYWQESLTNAKAFTPKKIQNFRFRDT